MLAILIKNASWKSRLNVFGQQIVISQLADDTTLFLKAVDQIPKVIEMIIFPHFQV